MQGSDGHQEANGRLAALENVAAQVKSLRGVVSNLTAASLTVGQQAPKRRRSQSFSQRDVARAVKATRAAGLDVAGVKVEKDGAITVIAGKPNDVAETNNEVLNADDELSRWRRRKDAR